MNRKILAKKLSAAKTEKARVALLRKNAERADIELAVELKEICYAAWTSDPVRSQMTARAAQTLARFNSEPEIRAYSFWINGIADLTAGKLDLTIRELDRSAEIFRRIGKENEAANTQVANMMKRSSAENPH